MTQHAGPGYAVARIERDAGLGAAIGAGAVDEQAREGERLACRERHAHALAFGSDLTQDGVRFRLHMLLEPGAVRAGDDGEAARALVHGSGPNRGSEPRVAFYTRYCVPWVRMMSEGGRPVLDDPHSWMVAGEARSSAV